jgi:hypothetical protein
MSNYNVKRPEHRNPAKPTKHPDTTATILAA